MGPKPLALLTVAFAALTLLLPASALSVTPQSGNYSYNRNNRFLVIQFQVTGNRQVKGFLRFHDRCTAFPLKVPSMKISTRGTFSFRGTAKNTTNQKFKAEITGKFVSSTKAKVTTQVTKTSRPRCVSPKLRYTAKRQGT